MFLSPALKKIILFGSLTLLVSCGGGGGGGSDPAPQTLQGTVLAPGGVVAFKQPTLVDTLLAAVLGKKASAALEGVVPAASAVVELIEVNSAGTQVGAVIASGTSAADGSFSIDLPNGFVLTANMVVRAEGVMDARVDNLDDVTVDPVSNAASQFIVDNAIDLNELTVDEVAEINDAVESIAQEVENLSGDVSAYTDALISQATNDEETSAIVDNTDTTGSICGTVTDDSSSPLENIRIIVKTYNNPITVAKGKTEADGGYCVNVPDGQYMVGAFNYTNTSFAASEWYVSTSPSGAGGTSQFDAEPVDVSGTTPVTVDFQLQPGSRIEGSVLAGVDYAGFTAGTPMEGVQVQVRQYDSFIPLTGVKVKADGSYRVNVPAGKYLLYIRNKTRFPYASQFYDNATGSATRNGAQPIVMTDGGETVVEDFNLRAGVKLSGTVMDGPVAPPAVPVSGMRVRVDMNSAPGGAAVRMRTNKLGQYKVWVEGSNEYTLRSRGQASVTAASLTTNEVHDFDAEMIKVTATLTLNGEPAREAKVILIDQPNVAIYSQEITNATGNVEMYAPTSGCADCRLNVVFDGGQFIATEFYLNRDVAADYDSIVIAAGAANTTHDVGSWTLREAGLLQGTAYTDNTRTTPEANVRVRARLVNGGSFSVNTRTRADGTYNMSLPAGVYDLIRVEHAGGTVDYTGGTAVTITANQTTTLDSNP